jgi:hypothetical protein
MTVIDTRLDELDNIDLKSGGHDNRAAGMCLLELSSYLAGEPFSDHPECVSTVLGAFGRAWNDALNDEDRQKLKPYAARLIGTASTPEVELARSWMACDWLVRTFTPSWLRRAGLDDDAAALEALPKLTATELVDQAMPVLDRARASASAARAAARVAARVAAWVAARVAAEAAAEAAAGAAAEVAARAAARVAAWAAARAAAGAAAEAAAEAAAGAAARVAAEAAAGAAAGAAAEAAAGAALAPTVFALQDSAFDLLDRMIAVTPESRSPRES